MPFVDVAAVVPEVLLTVTKTPFPYPTPTQPELVGSVPEVHVTPLVETKVPAELNPAVTKTPFPYTMSLYDALTGSV
jgi:hypothetical protein